MRDRPIAGILAAIAATMFVAAFAAAAVTRPDSAGVPAAARTAPAVAQENANLATIGSPSLSRVAGLPALHLAKRKPVKKSRPAPKPKPSAPAPRTTARSVAAAARTTGPPVATAAARTTAPPVATAAPRASRPVAPAPPRKQSDVGQTFDSEG